jgi:23S rRNA (cytidine1920-2'-O)/16S rRNA (cytidine1409-2'-O)-methyltransferase
VAGVARRRLDAELVRRKLARSREHASQLIAAGRVTVGKTVATKPATQVETAAAIAVQADDSDPDYVSRGGHKLAGALEAFVPQGLVVEGRRALDAGASTGGFTDVLLRAGAAHVVAVDVGYGQLAWSLQQDERVTVKDRTNVRELTLEAIDGVPVELVVGDLSFIPLGLVLPALKRCVTPDADLVMMVKPQFEVGKDRLGSGGVVRSPELRAETVRKVAEQAWELGLGVRAVTASPLPGPSGNVEYFLWLRAGAPRVDPADVDRAVAERVLFSCSPTPGGPRRSAARNSSSRACCGTASGCGCWRRRRATCRSRTRCTSSRRPPRSAWTAVSC